MQINDLAHSKLAIWVGATTRTPAAGRVFRRWWQWGGANNLPRWPEVTAIVKRILKAYQQDAKDWQRINDWLDRISWPRFFKLTNLPFTKVHVDN